MQNHEKRVPEVRFRGFSDDWEQRSLGEISESLEYGLNASAMEFDGENKYIRITDIDDNSHEFLKKNLTSPNIDLTSAHNYLLETGDILFARTGASVGKSYIYHDKDGKVYYAGFLIRARINSKYDPEFVFQNTLTIKYNNFIIITSQRSGQPGVNAQEYSSFSIMTPNLEEQNKIGQIFRQLDNTIALHQRKNNNLQQIKEGFLQRMLARKGKEQPVVRFSRFNLKWEEKKADKIFYSISDKNHPKLSILSASQEKGMIYRDELGIDIKHDEKNTNTYKRVLPGQFVIHLRSFQGGFAYSNLEGITSPAYTILDFIDKENQDPFFWRYVLTSKSFIKQLETVTYGVRDGRSISFKDFSLLKFIVPSHHEQQKIGNFLRQIDHNLASYQSKIEKLQSLKIAYSQKMFI